MVKPPYETKVGIFPLSLYHSGTQEDSNSPSLWTADPGSDRTAIVTFHVIGLMLAYLG